MIQPALLGGLFIGVLSALPVVSVGNVCCCAWVVGGGIVAAYVDSQQSRLSLPLRRGALAGFLAGVTGAFVWLVLAILLDPLLAPFQQQLNEAMLRRADAMPPEVREMFDDMANRRPSSFRFVVGFLVQLFVGMIFGALGGMIGAFWFRRDVPPALGGDYVPPLPPTM